MKRLSNKKRALIYIREKNSLRTGKRVIRYFKITNELVDDVCLVLGQVNTDVKYMSKKFKLDLKHYDLEFGIDGCDFIYNLQTVRYKIKNKAL